MKDSTNKSKKEEDLRYKVEEAEHFYRNNMKIANEMYNASEKTKGRIVVQTKQMVNECDRTFRSVTRKYFDMMHELAVPTPTHFKTLADSCQGYEPGKQFEDFVRCQQSTARPAVTPFFEFQPYGGYVCLRNFVCFLLQPSVQFFSQLIIYIKINFSILIVLEHCNS